MTEKSFNTRDRATWDAAVEFMATHPEPLSVAAQDRAYAEYRSQDLPDPLDATSLVAGEPAPSGEWEPLAFAGAGA